MQVLVNPTLLARVKWVYWDMYQHPSIGTLAYNAHTFVAGFEMEDGRRIPGELDFDRGLNGNIKVFSKSKLKHALQDRILQIIRLVGGY